MDFEQEKTTALYPPVGADGGQPLSKETNQSIAEDTAEYKTQADDLEEIMQQIRRASDPAYLPTVSMNDLYEQVFPGRPPVIDGLLYAGTYLFVGAPKVGKSFLMAQLAYHVSMGIPLWGYAVNPISIKREMCECRKSWILMRLTPASFAPLSISRWR